MAMYAVSGKSRITNVLNGMKDDEAVFLMYPIDGDTDNWFEKHLRADEAKKIVSGLKTFNEMQFSHLIY